MESTNQGSGSRTRLRIFANFMSVAVFILVIFMTSILVGLQQDVSHLRDELATKEDLTNLAVNLGPSDPAMAALEGTCTDCHTKETFAAAHNMTEDVHDLVTRMAQLSGAHFGTEEIPRAEAALTFMKCSHCHSSDRLKELAILSPAERWEVIIGMMKKEGSTITQEDARRIRDFYGDFWGWHSP
ncbi:MAG: hypothetical protein R6W82_07755 [bacterium]